MNETPIRSLATVGDDVTEIEDTFGNARVEWNNGAPCIIWNEHMKFHTEALDVDQTFGHNSTLPGRVEEELQRLLDQAHAGDYVCSVRWSDQDDVDGFGFLELEVWPSATLDPSFVQDSVYELILWPAIATLFNVTDPGTFNSEYLFTRLAVEPASEDVKSRLAFLRGEIVAESISAAEVAELQGLAEYVDPSDTLLLEWAGVPEHGRN